MPNTSPADIEIRLMNSLIKIRSVARQRVQRANEEALIAAPLSILNITGFFGSVRSVFIRVARTFNRELENAAAVEVIARLNLQPISPKPAGSVISVRRALDRSATNGLSNETPSNVLTDSKIDKAAI